MIVPLRILNANLESIRNFDTTFGSVIASGFGKAEADGYYVSEDWLVIKVNSDRVGMNCVRAAVGSGLRGATEIFWTPRDLNSSFMKGVANIQKE